MKQPDQCSLSGQILSVCALLPSGFVLIIGLKLCCCRTVEMSKASNFLVIKRVKRCIHPTHCHLPDYGHKAQQALRAAGKCLYLGGQEPGENWQADLRGQVEYKYFIDSVTPI